MNLGVQDLIALTFVFCAAGYLARLAWNAVRRKSQAGCGSGCAKCASGSKAAPAPVDVVSIGTSPRC